MTANTKLVDKTFALSQLGGNADLLKRMLDKFKDEFKPLPSEVKGLLDQGELKEAKLKVHTTKGLSGNLGLMALFECSKELDAQIREENIDLELVNQFESIMLETCKSIELLDLDTQEPPEFTNKARETSDKDVFLQRLQRHEFIDDQTLHNYVESLSLSVEKKHQLTELVEELQYAKAIELIKQCD